MDKCLLRCFQHFLCVLTAHIIHGALVPLASLLRSGLRSSGPSVFWGQNWIITCRFTFIFFFPPSVSGGIRNWGIKTRKQNNPDCLAYHTAHLVCNLTHQLYSYYTLGIICVFPPLGFRSLPTCLSHKFVISLETRTTHYFFFYNSGILT